MFSVDQRSVVARDGTRIGYQVRGDGPCVVLANGLGGTYIAFKYLYEALAGYKVICWDYRGLYTSAAPKDPLANTIVHQVDDLMAILDQEHVDDFVIAGWSMGVQVALETIRIHRERVRGLYIINGTYGRTFRTVMGSRIVGRVIPALLRLIKAQAGLAGRATKIVAGSDALISAMKRFGLVSPTIDMEIFRIVAGGFQSIDWAIDSRPARAARRARRGERARDNRYSDRDRDRERRFDDAAGDRRAHAPPDPRQPARDDRGRHALHAGRVPRRPRRGAQSLARSDPRLATQRSRRVKCPSCNADVLDIDVKCPSCGVALAATGAHRMLGQVVLERRTSSST